MVKVLIKADSSIIVKESGSTGTKDADPKRGKTAL
jgi:hypothetical protein